MPEKHRCASNVVLGETDELEETGASKKMKKILLIESSPTGNH
jgi:hypothetical protein